VAHLQKAKLQGRRHTTGHRRGGQSFSPAGGIACPCPCCARLCCASPRCSSPNCSNPCWPYTCPCPCPFPYTTPARTPASSSAPPAAAPTSLAPSPAHSSLGPTVTPPAGAGAGAGAGVPVELWSLKPLPWEGLWASLYQRGYTGAHPRGLAYQGCARAPNPGGGGHAAGPVCVRAPPRLRTGEGAAAARGHTGGAPTAGRRNRGAPGAHLGCTWGTGCAQEPLLRGGGCQGMHCEGRGGRCRRQC